MPDDLGERILSIRRLFRSQGIGELFIRSEMRVRGRQTVFAATGCSRVPDFPILNSNPFWHVLNLDVLPENHSLTRIISHVAVSVFSDGGAASADPSTRLRSTAVCRFGPVTIPLQLKKKKPKCWPEPGPQNALGRRSSSCFPTSTYVYLHDHPRLAGDVKDVSRD